MDAIGQGEHMVVTRANDDTCVRCHLGVQAHKVAPIERHHRSTRRSRKRDDCCICDALSRLACLVCGGREHGCTLVDDEMTQRHMCSDLFFSFIVIKRPERPCLERLCDMVPYLAQGVHLVEILVYTLEEFAQMGNIGLG